jgi:hypothetical protein
MANRGLLYLSVFVLQAIASAAAAAFGPGEAAGHYQPGRAAQHTPGTADFKVLVWYLKTDPLGTFKYQVYDLRKGEYSAKVDDWIKDVQTKYPAYIVLVREVDLKREKGGTEMLKVGAVIQRELIVAASFAGIAIGAGPGLTPRSGSGMSQGSLNASPGQGRQLHRIPGSVGVNRDFLNPIPTPFPVPVPYPHLPR